MNTTHAIFRADFYFPRAKPDTSLCTLLLVGVAVAFVILTLNVVLAGEEAKMHEVEKSLQTNLK